MYILNGPTVTSEYFKIANEDSLSRWGEYFLCNQTKGCRYGTVISVCGSAFNGRKMCNWSTLSAASRTQQRAEHHHGKWALRKGLQNERAFDLPPKRRTQVTVGPSTGYCTCTCHSFVSYHETFEQTTKANICSRVIITLGIETSSTNSGVHHSLAGVCAAVSSPISPLDPGNASRNRNIWR